MLWPRWTPVDDSFPGTRKASKKGRTYVLRGRVRCGLCGRRMQGSHQKHKNWYRCLHSTDRGVVAADASGHPRTLGIKEEVVLEALTDFLGRRIFGPERLAFLSAELAQATSASWKEHDGDLERLTDEEAEVDRGLPRQALRLEEHDDPGHPVVALATRRIEELSARREGLRGPSKRCAPRDRKGHIPTTSQRCWRRSRIFGRPSAKRMRPS